MRFVLVHGAWHDGRCWTPLVEELRRRGHEGLAVDLPADRPGLGAAAYAEVVVAAATAGRGPVTLVGHSLGGLTVPVAAQQLAGRVDVAAVVLVAPLLPRPGTSVDARARAGDGVLAAGFGAGQVRHDDRTTSWPAAAAGSGLYAGVADELGRGGADAVARAVAGLRRQAWPITREVTPLTSWPAVPTTVVVCGADRVVDPARLRVAAGEVPGATTVELPGGHFPMLTRPAALAELLVAGDGGQAPATASARRSG